VLKCARCFTLDLVSVVTTENKRIFIFCFKGTLSCAFVLSIFLNFDWRRDSLWKSEVSEPEDGVVAHFKIGFHETLLLYQMMEVQQFSVFLLVSNAVHPLVLTFMQSLIYDLQPSIVVYNAYLLSFATLLSCACALLPVLFLQRERLARARKVLLFAPAVCAALLSLMSNYGSFLGEVKQSVKNTFLYVIFCSLQDCLAVIRRLCVVSMRF
jgi:hypothetical protein